MGWSQWLKFHVEDNGKVDTTNLYQIPQTGGVYAIATRAFGGMQIHYVGRSKNNMKGRLRSHFGMYKNGSEQIRVLLLAKKDNSNMPINGFYVTFLPTKGHKILEQKIIKNLDPLLNIDGGLELPEGLTYEDVLNSPLENE